MKSTGLRYLVTMMALSFAAGSSITAAPLGTAFNYQGRLSSDTNAANGLYDFQFGLWDGSGNSSTQIGTTQTVSGVTINNGVFNVLLDFGAAAFNGEARWLEVAVRTNGDLLFTTLSPRQNLTPVPYALAASNLSGTLPTAQLTGTLSGGFLSGIYNNAVTLNNPANTFAGNGSALTGVDATTLGGFGFCSLPCYWNLSGNTGTTPGTNFLGTRDNQPLELKVNNQRAFRLEPTTNSPNVIGGFLGNFVNNFAVGVTIAGGGAKTMTNAVSGIPLSNLERAFRALKPSAEARETLS